NLDHPKMDGVSTNLALIFGTLLSSQGADASFVPVSRPSGRFLRFRLYQIFPTRFPRRFPVRIRFRFSALPAGVKHYQAFSLPLTTPLRARRGVDHWG
ncbi:hypothetical protein ACH414_26240, partial [Streptomyces sp. NPDC020422]|uniref:hypothetical protein n=1 Tax=Streptomyces sp. NPDC020422 TaxID=3365074 RepID=UPI0037B321B3